MKGDGIIAALRAVERQEEIENQARELGAQDDEKVDVEAYNGAKSEQVPLATFLKYAVMERELEDKEYKKKKGGDVDEQRVESLEQDLGLQDEIRRANRSLKAATWFNIFTLITTDIIGPQKAPWAFSQLGYVPATIIYVVFGAIATYTGWQLSLMFLRLSSSRFPLGNFSELPARVFGGQVGKYLRHLMDTMQTIQFVFLLSGLILQNGQALSQMAHGSACFSGLMLAFAGAGILINQIRSLKNLSKLTFFNVFINLLVLFVTMGVVAHSAPNYQAAYRNNGVSGTEVITSAFVSNPMSRKFVGAMNISYAYGGAMLFIEFCAEMQRPRDFWKSLVCAQLVIVFVYLMYGIFVYSYQGQFSINPANQGISLYKWQTAMNALILFTQFVSAAIYSNVALKVIYRVIIERLLHGPPMVSVRGRIVWSVSVVLYYILAFVVASAIPQFSNVTAFFAALFMLPFSYLFPPLMMASLRIRIDGLKGGFKKVEITNKAWWKQAVGPLWYMKAFDIVLALATGACMGLGCWSSIIAMVDTFKQAGAATSFGCQSPV
uniref:ARAD1D06270p n=1 Tax=Blastobotrys adeninivorans TaxID=409370 RepID=A0A060TED3_BLAAD